jgi:hypothetical protein
VLCSDIDLLRCYDDHKLLGDRVAAAYHRSTALSAVFLDQYPTSYCYWCWRFSIATTRWTSTGIVPGDLDICEQYVHVQSEEVSNLLN